MDAQRTEPATSGVPLTFHPQEHLGARLVPRDGLLEQFWTGSTLAWEAAPAETVALAPYVLRELCRTGNHLEYNNFFARSDYTARAVTFWRLANATYYPKHGGFLRLRDGLYFSEALSGRWANEEMEGVPGVCIDADGEKRFVGHHGVPVRVLAHPRPLLLLTNSAWCNYGHFFLDSLCSLMPFLDDIRSGRLGVLCAPLWHAWQREALAMLGVPQAAVVEVDDDIVVVGDLIAASPVSSEHTRHPSRLAVDLFTSLREAAANVPLPQGLSPRLYLRRTTKRFLTEAEAFEAFLKTRGFSIIEPETFTIAQQAAIFGQARVIVSVFGASLLNVGFAQPGCRVMEIRPETSNDPWTMHLCARMGHFYTTQVAEVREEEVVWERLGSRAYDREYPMHIPLATLRAAVEALLGR